MVKISIIFQKFNNFFQKIQFELKHPVEWVLATEIIYPAAPLFRKRSGFNSSLDSNSAGGCDCTQVEIVTTNEAVLRKHGELLGRYNKISSVKSSGLYNGRPAYEHFSGKYIKSTHSVKISGFFYTLRFYVKSILTF